MREAEQGDGSMALNSPWGFPTLGRVEDPRAAHYMDGGVFRFLLGISWLRSGHIDPGRRRPVVTPE